MGPRTVKRSSAHFYVRVAAVAAATALGVVGCTRAAETVAPSSLPSPGSELPVGTIVFDLAIPGTDGDNQLFTVYPDGSHLQLLRAHSCCGSLAPDGRSVADAAVTSGGRYTVATFGLDGSAWEPLPVHGDIGVGPWSPDGRRIADEGRNGIYTFLASDGGHVFQVTRSPGHDIPIAYSPDGSRILFVRSAGAGEGPDSDDDLYAVNIDGTGLIRLSPRGTTTALMEHPVSGTASWSPDGSQVAFIAAEGSFADGDARSVYVVDADGSDPRKIVTDAEVWSAEWSPEGTWIAVAMPGSGTDVFVVRPDGSGLMDLTTSVDADFSFGPRWSPDGRWVLFVGGQGDLDHADLWIASVAGNQVIQLTHHAGFYSSYAWAPATP